MKFVVIEDHLLMADLISRVCVREIGATSVAQEQSGDKGLKAALTLRPELVIADLALPDRDGIDVLATIVQQLPSCRTLALTALEDPLTMIRIRELGIHGYAHKRDLTVPKLQEAILTVLSGKSYFSPVMSQVLAEYHKESCEFDLVLSDKEQQLLVYIANSCTDDEVAIQTGLRTSTVQSRRRDIMRKLNIHSTPKLMEYSSRMGFARLGLYLPKKLRVRWP